MSLKFKINNAGSSFVGYTFSTLFHVTILAFVLVALNLSGDRSRINPGLMQVTTQDFNSSNLRAEQKSSQSPKEFPAKKDEITPKDGKSDQPAELNENVQNAFYNLSNTNPDTSNLDQVYNEPSLNVTIKYPSGWRYMDQDLNKKLDGVTFWSTEGNFSPPPYINLEVKDKDLFDARRYKYNINTWRYTIYYNDPEEMKTRLVKSFT